MVLNTGGGNKGKGVARKFVSQNAGGGGAKTVRLAQAEGETYAIVKQLLGNCMCSVICSDGYKRLCIIRKKFTGRRKADNNVMSGTVVLVGKHDYGASASASSSSSSSSALKCDLLYVYGDQEREKLRKVCDLSKLNAAVGGGDTPASARQDDDGVKFVTSGTGVFNKYATEDSRKNVRTVAGLDALGENPATESARQTIIFGNQWIGEGMLPSDEEDEEDEGGDEEEDEDEDGQDEEEEEEEAVRIIAPAHNKQQSTHTHTHKQQRSQVQFINVDDI
jgi:initiation factor 1A